MAEGAGVGEGLVRLYERLKVERGCFEGDWDFARWFVLPQRVYDGGLTRPPEAQQDNLVNTVAAESAEKLAGAHMTMITPSHAEWFHLECPDELKLEDSEREEARGWYNECTEVLFQAIAESNFYPELHEVCLDRVGFGVGALFTGVRRDGGLMYAHVACGDFAAGLDDEGREDVVVREMVLSAYECVRMFGRDRLGGEMVKDLNAGNGREYERRHRVLHVVRYAGEAAAGAVRDGSGSGWLWRSWYVSAVDKVVLQEGGYEEMPYTIFPFLKMSRSPYGYMPWRKVKGAILSAQRNDYVLDEGAAASVFPRIKQLAGQVGTINLRAGGKTVVSQEALAGGMSFPDVWAPVGNIEYGLERLADKERKVKGAFYVPMIDMFEGLDKRNMTATEVLARQNHEVLNFSPAYLLYAIRLEAVVKRSFMLQLRARRFKRPPDCLVEAVRVVNGREEVVLKDPKVTFCGKIALVLRKLKSEAWLGSVAQLREGGVLEAAPEVLDHVDMDGEVRRWLRANGMSEEGLRAEDEVEEMRRMRAEGEAQAAQAEMMRSLMAGAKDGAQADLLNAKAGEGGGM